MKISVPLLLFLILAIMCKILLEMSDSFNHDDYLTIVRIGIVVLIFGFFVDAISHK